METLSPEKSEVRYAGFWLRFVAYLIDDLILSIVGFFVSLPFIGGIVLSAIGIGEHSDFDETAFLGVAGILGFVFGLVIIIVAMGWLYFSLMESSNNMGTLGKMALGLKVTDMNGNRISFARATGRYFGKIISGMILYVGYIMAGLTEKKQALHDMLADCLVVRR